MISPRHRRGFTLLEALSVSGLMAGLAMLLAATWAGLGRPAAALIARSQLVQERDLAAAALSRDLGGCLVVPNPTDGTRDLLRFVDWRTLGQDLQICYGAPPDPGDPTCWAAPNTVIHYLLQSNTLVRCDETAVPATQFTVARNVDSMTVTPVGDNMHIVLSFKYREIPLTCDLTAKKP